MRLRIDTREVPAVYPSAGRLGVRPGATVGPSGPTVRGRRNSGGGTRLWRDVSPR